MGRPATITDEALLAVAAEVFQEHGMRATTAEVAQRAGVSEGVVFKRFRSKNELFQRAMQAALEAQAACMPKLEALVGQGEVRESLARLCWSMIERYRVVVPLVLTAVHHAPEGCRPPDMDSEEPMPIRWHRRLRGFLQAEMDLGRIRAANADVLSRILAGTCWNYVHFDVSMPGKMPLDAEIFVQGLVDLVLRGVAAPASPPSPAPRPASSSRTTSRTARSLSARTVGGRS